MNFSAISNTHFIGRMLRQPLKLIPANTPVRILQGKLRGKRWIAGSSIHGCWLGSYENDKQALFGSAVQEGEIVFDIGANVGYYTLLASELVGPSGEVYAFEPLPRNIRFLNRHLTLNSITNAKVIEAAVSDVNGEATFDDSPSNSMGHLSTSGSLKVRTVTIDSLVSEGKIPAPDCMKIDVEGSEALVLSGAKSTLINYRPIIFLATHGAVVHEQCCDLLKGLGYQIEGLGGASIVQCDELVAHYA